MGHIDGESVRLSAISGELVLRRRDHRRIQDNRTDGHPTLSEGIPIAIIPFNAALGMNMASLISRNLDDELTAKLRFQAAAHGNSIQESLPAKPPHSAER
jgi:hypothetical protein